MLSPPDSGAHKPSRAQKSFTPTRDETLTAHAESIIYCEDVGKGTFERFSGAFFSRELQQFYFASHRVNTHFSLSPSHSFRHKKKCRLRAGAGTFLLEELLAVHSSSSSAACRAARSLAAPLRAVDFVPKPARRKFPQKKLFFGWASRGGEKSGESQTKTTTSDERVFEHRKASRGKVFSALPARHSIIPQTEAHSTRCARRAGEIFSRVLLLFSLGSSAPLGEVARKGQKREKLWGKISWWLAGFAFLAFLSFCGELLPPLRRRMSELWVVVEEEKELFFLLYQLRSWACVGVSCGRLARNFFSISSHQFSMTQSLLRISPSLLFAWISFSTHSLHPLTTLSFAGEITAETSGGKIWSKLTSCLLIVSPSLGVG